MKHLAWLGFLVFSQIIHAQNSFQFKVVEASTNTALENVEITLHNSDIFCITDSLGNATLEQIPSGKQRIIFKLDGFDEWIETITFPIQQSEPKTIELSPSINEDSEDSEELEGVYIEATRGSRTIANIPTRVEVISGEELAEKANMKPGDIRVLLAESTGIQTQQTSATSANASIRIQGLDGKYTQLIRDGFPLYSGFSSGLGLLQIAPLDLKQVEIIKGSSSTLYGGDAIAGLVNLVSKTPTEKRELNFLLNGTSALGLDASTFYSQKFNKIGFTIYGAYNKGSAYDPSDVGLTAIPKFDRFTFNPKLFIYPNQNSQLSIGFNLNSEKRIGGDIEYVKGHESEEHIYYEKNKTTRFSSQTEFKHSFNATNTLVLKNSVNYFDRSISIPDYTFSGEQISTYSEANYKHTNENMEWIFGANLLSDQFKEKQRSSLELRNYNYITLGFFAQNTWSISSKITLESGIRGDFHNEFGFLFLPRISGLWKINSHFTTRLSGGLGYKAPSVFTEDAERIQFRQVLPINQDNTKAEHSAGANFDVNYKTRLFSGNVGFFVNQMFFYTRVNHPVLLTQLDDGHFAYLQPDGHLETKGMETNLKITYSDFKLFVGYTFADVKQTIENRTNTYPLVSKHRLNNILMYEIEDKWKIGAEAYYFSKQKLNDGLNGKSYWTVGLMAEKLWENFSIFINFENLTDTRQTKFDSIYTGSLINPTFRDIYAPLDGFVVNGGIKIKL